MTRLASALAVASLMLGCQRGKEQAVFIQPTAAELSPHSLPGDPFAADRGAYSKLREVTDRARASTWNGRLEDFGRWLEEETEAVERALALLKALRVGASDAYAVANGRIAMLYEHIAGALGEASRLANGAGFEADWKGQEARVWAQANAFWARCERGCHAGGIHLDAWELRCRTGLADTQAKLGP